MRGFLGGVVWGGIVTGGGLAVLSLLMPLPQRAANDPGPVTAVPPAAEILTEAAPSVLPEAPSEPVPEVAAEAPPAEFFGNPANDRIRAFIGRMTPH